MRGWITIVWSPPMTRHWHFEEIWMMLKLTTKPYFKSIPNTTKQTITSLFSTNLKSVFG